VCICGAEVSGRIALKASIEEKLLPTPCVETENFIYFIGSAKPLDKCEKIVIKKTHDFLTNVASMSVNDAAKIMSLTGELQICQVVDPLKTMRFALPKYLMAKTIV